MASLFSRIGSTAQYLCQAPFRAWNEVNGIADYLDVQDARAEEQIRNRGEAILFHLPLPSGTTFKIFVVSFPLLALSYVKKMINEFSGSCEISNSTCILTDRSFQVLTITVLTCAGTLVFKQFLNQLQLEE